MSEPPLVHLSQICSQWRPSESEQAHTAACSGALKVRGTLRGKLQLPFVGCLQALEWRGLTYMPSAFSLKDTFQVCLTQDKVYDE